MEQIKKEKAVSLIIKRKLIGEYQINEFGKPISNAKHFNISHSNGVVVYVEGDTNIGIDIARNLIEKYKFYVDPNDYKKFERELRKNILILNSFFLSPNSHFKGY